MYCRTGEGNPIFSMSNDQKISLNPSFVSGIKSLNFTTPPTLVFLTFIDNDEICFFKFI